MKKVTITLYVQCNEGETTKMIEDATQEICSYVFEDFGKHRSVQSISVEDMGLSQY